MLNTSFDTHGRDGAGFFEGYAQAPRLDRPRAFYSSPYGRAHDYEIPEPELIEGELLHLILGRGGVVNPESGSRTRKHALLVALAQLGDDDAAAYLRSKGFLTPAPLVPRECPDCAERPQLGPEMFLPVTPAHMVEIVGERVGEIARLTVAIDPRPLTDVLASAQAALRALAARVFDRAREKVRDADRAMMRSV